MIGGKRLIVINAIYLCLAVSTELQCQSYIGNEDDSSSYEHESYETNEVGSLIDSAPWLVSLQDHRYQSPRHFCGGVIIDNTTVLTTAFCVRAYKPRNIQVIAGESDMSKHSGNEQIMNVTKIIIHEHFNTFTQSNDIAILKIAQPFVMTQHVSTAKIEPHLKKIYIGEDCTIYGWKVTEKNGFVSPILKEKTIHVISYDECLKNYPGLISKTSNICGNNFGLQTTCYGDFGGPLTCRDQIFVGIASWSNGCQKSFPVVFVNVMKYLKWIRDNS